MRTITTIEGSALSLHAMLVQHCNAVDDAIRRLDKKQVLGAGFDIERVSGVKNKEYIKTISIRGKIKFFVVTKRYGSGCVSEVIDPN